MQQLVRYHLIKLALQDGLALQKPTNPRKLNTGRCEASVEESAQNARDGHAPTSPEVPATHAITHPRTSGNTAAQAECAQGAKSRRLQHCPSHRVNLRDQKAQKGGNSTLASGSNRSGN